jgi:general stress protein CsbA
VSFTNIIISSVWIGIVLMVILIMRRGKAKYSRAEYENQ